MTEGRFARLPEPVRLEDTVASEEVTDHPQPVINLVDEWLLRNAAG